jgi:hypothetical protein
MTVSPFAVANRLPGIEGDGRRLRVIVETPHDVTVLQA